MKNPKYRDTVSTSQSGGRKQTTNEWQEKSGVACKQLLAVKPMGWEIPL
jgi:hypothetical protein